MKALRDLSRSAKQRRATEQTIESIELDKRGLPRIAQSEAATSPPLLANGCLAPITPPALRVSRSQHAPIAVAVQYRDVADSRRHAATSGRWTIRLALVRGI
jgi:hypothetical protein